MSLGLVSIAVGGSARLHEDKHEVLLAVDGQLFAPLESVGLEGAAQCACVVVTIEVSIEVDDIFLIIGNHSFSITLSFRTLRGVLSHTDSFTKLELFNQMSKLKNKMRISRVKRLFVLLFCRKKLLHLRQNTQ